MTGDQTARLREHLLYLLKGGGAHLNFDKAIADLPAELRGAKPPERPAHAVAAPGAPAHRPVGHPGVHAQPASRLAAVAGGLLAGRRRPARRRGLGPERGGLPRRPAVDAGPGGRPGHGSVHAAAARRGADGPARGAAGRRPQRLSPRPTGHGPTALGRLERRGLEEPAAGHSRSCSGGIARQPAAAPLPQSIAFRRIFCLTPAVRSGGGAASDRCRDESPTGGIS